MKKLETKFLHLLLSCLTLKTLSMITLIIIVLEALAPYLFETLTTAKWLFALVALPLFLFSHKLFKMDLLEFGWKGLLFKPILLACLMLGDMSVSAQTPPNNVIEDACQDQLVIDEAFEDWVNSTAISGSCPFVWNVQSDYFGERNTIAQTRTIRSMAVSKDGSSVYTGNIQSPNVSTNAIRRVSSGILAVPGTDHVIFGNGMPGGTGGFGQVGGQPVYAGGGTGTFLNWAATPNSPVSMDTDDRGYLYAAFSSSISPANIVRIYSADLSTIYGVLSISGPLGVAVQKIGSDYFMFVTDGNILRKYNVSNLPAIVQDMSYSPPPMTGGVGLVVDKDGVAFVTGNNQVRRVSANGTTITHTVTLSNSADAAIYKDTLYVIRQVSPTQPIARYLKADLSSAGASLVTPELGAFTRGSLSQFTAIDISNDGKIYVSEENYTSGSNGIPSYTPPATTFNPTPGAITGRIYFDRVLVSTPIEPVVLNNDATVAPSACGGSVDVTWTELSNCEPDESFTRTFTVTAAPAVLLNCPTNAVVSACQNQTTIDAAFASWVAGATNSGGCNAVLNNNATTAPPACGGNVDVTWTVESDCEPDVVCTRTFTVTAAPAVILNCPTNLIITACQNQSTINAAFDAWVAGATFSGGCNAVLTNNASAAPPTSGGSVDVTWTVESDCEADVTCTRTVTVIDNLAPVPVCQNVYTQLGPGSTVTVTTGQVNNGSTDNCGTVNLVSVTPNTFTAEGAYLVTLLVNDGNGNDATCHATISVGPLATASNNGAICQNNQLLLFATGGVSYSWNGPNGFSSFAQNPIINNATTAMSGTYTVTVTGALGFTATASTNVIVGSYPSGSLMVMSNSVCVGSTISVTAFGGSNYQWSGPNGYVSSGATLTRVNATNSMTGLYSVTITNSSNCSALLTTNITVHSNPVVTISGATNVCTGQAISLTATGGGTYSWSGPGGYSTTSANLFRNNATLAMAGTYTVTVTNTNGCTSTANVVVAVGTAPAASISGSTGACVGGTLSLTASGGVSYLWSGPGGYSANTATINRTNVTNAMAGIYAVTVTGANGCTVMTAVSVTTNSASASITGNNNFCVGSTITLTASGGTSYLWSGPGGFTANTATMNRSSATSAMAGTYTVTVTSAAGCTATANRAITVSSPFTANITGTLIYCEGTTIALNASGGTTYAWSGPDGYTSVGAALSRASATISMAGVYVVTVTNSGGCTASTSRTVTVNALPTASITGNNVICAGSTLSLTASGGTTYAWSGPGFSASTATMTRTNATVAMSGTYIVTVTGTGGCKSTTSIVVTINAKPVATITGSASVCNGSTLYLTATGGEFYSWAGPGGFTYFGETMERTGMIAANAGNYTVTVTNAAGCTGTVAKNISVLAVPTANISGTLTYCAGANIGLTASGGSFYQWAGPGGFTASTASFARSNATVAMSGDYSVTVTTSNGCTNTAERTITVNPLPIATASSNSLVCTGTNMTLFGSGGIAYSWKGPNLYSSTLQNPVRTNATVSMGGTYNLTVTDANGCKGITNTVVLVMACSGKTEVATQAFEYLTAYPNPTDGLTTVAFTALKNEHIQLKVIAADGREVALLFDGSTQAGSPNEISFNMNHLPSGTYYAVLQSASGETSQIRLMVVR